MTKKCFQALYFLFYNTITANRMPKFHAHLIYRYKLSERSVLVRERCFFCLWGIYNNQKQIFNVVKYRNM